MTHRIAKRHRVTLANIRAAKPETLGVRPLGGNLLEVFTIENGSMTRLGRIRCGSTHERLIQKLCSANLNPLEK